MALVPIKLTPGINSVRTPTLNEGGWSAASNIRFFQGLPQKDGGFIGLVTLSGIGVPRAIKAWTALSGIVYLGVSGTQRLNVWNPSLGVIDATPITTLALVPISLSTTAGSPNVVIRDTTNTPSVGQPIFIREPVSVGGIVLAGNNIVTAVGTNTYTVTSPVNASSTVVNGGVCRVFTTNGTNVVNVYLPNHGLFTGQIVQVLDPVTISGLTIQGNYLATAIDASNYTITVPGSPAIGTASVTENAGNLNITFWAGTGGTPNIPAGTSTLDNWGEFLLDCPERGPVYVWQPRVGGSATRVATAPQANGVIFVASQTQQLVCLGTINRATNLYDPMLAAFSDVGDYTSFVPTVSNQAGSFRLSLGSELRAGLALPGQNYLWTDTTLYSMQYIQPPLVYGFQPIGFNCGADGPHAIGIANDQIVWKSQNQFFALVGGSPQAIKCPVWDQVFPNQRRASLKHVTCEPNDYFGEVAWSVPQNDGTFMQARLKVATMGSDDPEWTASPYHHHTGWQNQNPFGAPIGAHENGYIDQHEIGVDADGQPAAYSLTTGMIMVAEGDEAMFIRQVIPDINWLKPGTMNMTAFFYDVPNKPPRVKGPVTITPSTLTAPGIRGRARQVQFKYDGNDLGSMPRWGLMRFRGHPDGKR